MKGFFKKNKKVSNQTAESVKVDERADLSPINEAVNLTDNLIFIAIPKTGSTSIRKQVREVGRPLIDHSHLNILQVKELLYVQLLRENLGANRAFPTKGVVDDNTLRVRAEDTFSDLFKFSAVRNPWARAVSLYFRREGVQVKNSISFEEFCEAHLYASDTSIHPTLHRNQLDWICDENGSVILDYVFKIEEFDKATKEIELLTNGRLMLKDMRENQNPDSKSSNYQEMFSDRTRKLIATRFEKDIDFFKYTF